MSTETPKESLSVAKRNLTFLQNANGAFGEWDTEKLIEVVHLYLAETSNAARMAMWRDAMEGLREIDEENSEKEFECVADLGNAANAQSTINAIDSTRGDYFGLIGVIDRRIDTENLSRFLEAGRMRDFESTLASMVRCGEKNPNEEQAILMAGYRRDLSAFANRNRPADQQLAWDAEKKWWLIGDEYASRGFPDWRNAPENEVAEMPSES